MKVWITKYALTNGIIEVDGDISTCSTKLFTYRHGAGTFMQSAYGEGKEWHRTREEAVVRAEEMRITKLKSLDKSIKKISSIKF